MSSVEFPRPDVSEWRRRVEQGLAGRPFDEALTQHSLEGIELEPLFTERPAGSPPGTAVEQGAAAAFGRWRIGQEVAQPWVLDAARAMDADQRDGVELYWLRCGSPAARTRRELETATACDGVHLSDVHDAEELVETLAVDTCFVLEAGADALALAATWVAAARGLGFEPESLLGSFGCDPLATLAATGRLAGGLSCAFRQMADLAAWTGDRAPGARAVMVSTRPYHEAGCHRAQELAYALATGVEYLRRMTAAGLPLAAAVRQIDFAFSVDSELFAEIAKLRAVRRLWTKVRRAWGDGEAGATPSLYVRTSARESSRLELATNLLRAAAQGFAAAAGGADALVVAPHDAAAGWPSDAARGQAVAVQHLLRDEADLARVRDPGAGSWYLESYTDRLARSGWELFQDLERQGGMARCLLDGIVADQIAGVAEERLRRIKTQQSPKIGTSAFVDLAARPARAHPPERADESDDDLDDEGLSHVEALLDQALDATATSGRPEAGLAVVDLSVVAPGDPGELMDVSVDAAAAGAFTHELAARLWAGGEAVECRRLTPIRPAEVFEDLRAAVDGWTTEQGHPPRAVLVELDGEGGADAPPAVIRELLATTGIDATVAGEDPEAAFAEPGARIAVVFGAGAGDLQRVAVEAERLRRAGAVCVVLARRAVDRAEMESAGVDDLLFAGCDVHAVGRGLLDRLGASV